MYNPRFSLILLLLAVAACADDTAADSPAPADAVVAITSPEDGDSFTRGDSVHLALSVMVGEKAVDPAHVTWTAGDDWTRDGAELDVTDLPEGDLTVKAEVLVDGVSYSDSVDVTVEPEEADADTDSDSDSDTDADADMDVQYLGTINAHVTLRGDFDYESDCPGSLHLSGSSKDGHFDGAGTCDLSGYEMVFTLEGTGWKGNLTGDLVMTDSGTEYRTPFSGTGSVGSKLAASYDETFADGGNSLRINGSWTADPQ